ncbi:MAG: AIPR family protein [Deltaproteobacteria bacterium]|nr:AIPR family protein [Deltaproteobacteria bacterium]
MIHRKDLFEFMLKQVKRTGDTHGDRLPQAFGRWFSTMFFPGVSSVMIPDGTGDGKIDVLVTCQVGKGLRYRILNTKFTEQYDKPSPVSFYDEITRYWQAFANKSNRTDYLNVVKEPLRPHFKKLFKLYDEGLANLYFVTNHRKNSSHYASVQNYDVDILHLDDVLQYVAEHIEGAMPETEPLFLTGIQTVLTPATNESEVPTSIVFARLVDFITYMEADPFDLLFARNVRLWLGPTETNVDIQKTFRDAPTEFAYSNNGITILCKKHTHETGKQELRLENPRVVNGSQTLHSVRLVDNPSCLARVMVRIIEVPPGGSHDLPIHLKKRKEIIHKISIRSNQQNPIKRWNLVANDDFQNELSRYFWDKRLYYERRQGEWKYRKLELTSVGIRRGPDIRWMTQLIAAYHYDRKKLGPATARGRLNELFDEEAYSLIRNTPPPLAYQLYLLGEITDRALRRLAGKKQYIRNVKGYVDLTAFACLCRILREGGVHLGKEDVNLALETEYDTDEKVWEVTVKAIVDHVLENFKSASASAVHKDGAPISVANYFKTTSLVGELMTRPIPHKLRSITARFR